MTLFVFLFFTIGVTGLIGFLAAKKSQKSGEDYFLASQGMSPYLLAFSSSASKYSGFMFIGLMSVAYTSGTAVIWLAAGILFGYLLVYAPVVIKLQKINTGGWALSIGELVTFWQGENRIWTRRLIGGLTLFFFTIYAAAQLRSGGKILQSFFDQPAYIGILLSSIIILFYCWSGGIRASIWTDCFQSLTMVVSLILIIATMVIKAGGVTPLITQFIEIGQPGSPEVTLIPQNLSIGGPSGFILFLLGSLSIGICALGNPHIVIRAMSLKTAKDAQKFIITNYLFELLFVPLFVIVGLLTRVILVDTNVTDSELSLIWSAEKILSPITLGIFISGFFSSALSTADSQIISCSSSLVRDLPEPPKDSFMLAKIGTVFITVLATLVAIFAKGSIFSLVIFAYSGLGVSIGSILILRLLNLNLPEWGVILMSLSGFATVIIWTQLGLNSMVNQSLPGWIVTFLIFIAVYTFQKIWTKTT